VVHKPNSKLKNVFNFSRHIIEAFREAFFQKHYKSVQLKVRIFKTLVVLIWKSKIHKNSAVHQDIFGFKVNANSPQVLLQLFKEIFLERVYYFECEQDEPKIIDAGANIGLSVLFFKFLYPKSKIIAIEPDPTAFEYLEENIAQNKIQGVELIKACVSDQKGKEVFYSSENLINSSLVGEGKGIAVEAVCLSDLLQKSAFDLVKLDIEGAEIKVFQNLFNTGLYSRSKQYILEYHEGKGMKERLPDIVGAFEDNGFGSKINTYKRGRRFSEVILEFSKNQFD
jgi:FkbM family methyltransferase